MGKTRNVVERFYERFGANDLDGVFACFAPECIADGIVWAARQLGAPRRCPCVEEGHARLPRGIGPWMMRST